MIHNSARLLCSYNYRSVIISGIHRGAIIQTLLKLNSSLRLIWEQVGEEVGFSKKVCALFVKQQILYNLSFPSSALAFMKKTSSEPQNSSN